MGSSRNEPDRALPRSKPATTPESQENRMIRLAVDMAEKQLQEGTASVQVLSHYLKLASTRENDEREKLRLENQLLKAKTDQIGSEAANKGTAAEALAAMRMYVGLTEDEVELD